MCRLVLILLFITCGVYAAENQAANQDLFPKALFQTASPSKVQTVIDPLTISLENGDIIRLDGINIPGVFAKDGPSGTAQKAKERLEELLKDQAIKLYQPRGKREDARNAFGHHLGQALTAQDEWLQYILVKEGLARAEPSAYTEGIMPILFDAEEQARNDSLGLWAIPDYTVIDVNAAQPDAYNMQIVQGVVQAVATIRNTAYINFGQDWRTDFTVMLEGPVRKALSKENIDPASWQGKTLRVRGYVEEYNGPMIKVLYPSQIEVLD